MRRALSGLVVCLGFVATTGAQFPPITPPKTTAPDPSSSTRETKRPLTVQGCLYGDRLEYDPALGINRPASTLIGDTDAAGGSNRGELGVFVLEGPKELLRQLKTYHNGHEEQISGMVTIPPHDNEDTLTTTKRLGPKTTMVASGSQPHKEDDKKPDGKRNAMLRLKVEEVVHVGEHCTSSR